MNAVQYKKTISLNLKRIRESKGLSTTIIAEILGVSQAKISYIEHCKGILSATDVAILSRRLDVPVSEFFSGLTDQDDSGMKGLTQHLARFGAVLLAKPKGIVVDSIPFEEVFSRALGFLEDERFHQGFLASLIIQASNHEIVVDRIFAQIGDNPFLVTRTLEESGFALQIIEQLKSIRKFSKTRSQRQILKIADEAHETLKAAGWKERIQKNDHIKDDRVPSFAMFVRECLNAKK